MKIFKEIMIMLLVCLVGILLFAVVFYQYIPNRKEVPAVKNYEASEQVLEQLSDDVNREKDKIIKTYEVTSVDLNNYKVEKEYVPGKANPFATTTNNVEEGATENPSNSKNGNSGSSSTGNTSESGDSSKEESDNSEYIRNKGTK